MEGRIRALIRALVAKTHTAEPADIEALRAPHSAPDIAPSSHHI